MNERTLVLGAFRGLKIVEIMCVHIATYLALSECARTCSACARHTCTAAADAYKLPGVREMRRLTSCGQRDPRGYPATGGQAAGGARAAVRVICSAPKYSQAMYSLKTSFSVSSK